MHTEDKVIEIFVMADEFCKILNAMLRRRGLDRPKDGRKCCQMKCFFFHLIMSDALR